MNNTLLYPLSVLVLLSISYAEYFWLNKKEGQNYKFDDLLIAVKLLFAGFFIDAVLRTFTLYILLRVYESSYFSLSATPIVYVLCFILWDFLHYIEHYLEHHVRLLWAVHINHHASKHMNFSTALRSGSLKAVYRFLFQIPVMLIGFPPEVFASVYAVGKLYAFLTHCQYLGEWKLAGKFLITPFHHAVHHSNDRSDYNRNFGESLVIWDKLFGTFKAKDHILQYGVDNMPENYNIQSVIFDEFKNIYRDVRSSDSISTALKYIFGRPGWKPQVGSKNRSPMVSELCSESAA